MLQVSQLPPGGGVPPAVPLPMAVWGGLSLLAGLGGLRGAAARRRVRGGERGGKGPGAVAVGEWGCGRFGFLPPR